MKVLVQWTKAAAENWQEIDSSQWASLPGRPKPVGGEAIDNQPGYIYALNVQGMRFRGADHYHIEEIAEGCRVTIWADDPDDYAADDFWAEVWEFRHLAPDDRLGGAYNTRQTVTSYRRGEALTRQLAAGPYDNKTIKSYDEFVPPTENVRHGIWAPNPDEHHAAQSKRGWREWTEGVPEHCLKDGKLCDQARIGRRVPHEHTRIWMARDTAQASNPHTADKELLFSITAATAGNLTASGDATTVWDQQWVWSTGALANGESDWPNGTYRFQIDCTTADTEITYGIKTINSVAGHFARLDSFPSYAHAQTWEQVEGTFSGTGLKLATTGTINPSAGAETDAWEAVLVIHCDGSAMHGTATFTQQVNETDDFTDGPWAPWVRTVTFAADTIISTATATYTVTFDADTIVVDRLTTAFDADVIIVDRIDPGPTFDVDTLLVNRLTAEFDADVQLILRPEITFDVDTLISDRLTTEFDADTLLVNRIDPGPTFDVDTLLVARLTAEFLADVLVSSRLTTAFDADALLVARFLETFLADTLISSRLTTAFDADTALVNRLTTAFDADTIIAGVATYTVTFDADAILVDRLTTTFDVDSILVDRLTAEFLADTLLVDRATVAFDADTILRAIVEISFDADTIIVNRQLVIFDADTLLVDRLTAIFDADTILNARLTVAFLADVLVRYRYDVRPRFDGPVQHLSTLPNHYDAVGGNTIPGTDDTSYIYFVSSAGIVRIDSFGLEMPGAVDRVGTIMAIVSHIRAWGHSPNPGSPQPQAMAKVDLTLHTTADLPGVWHDALDPVHHIWWDFTDRHDVDPTKQAPNNHIDWIDLPADETERFARVSSTVGGEWPSPGTDGEIRISEVYVHFVMYREWWEEENAPLTFPLSGPVSSPAAAAIYVIHFNADAWVSQRKTASFDADVIVSSGVFAEEITIAATVKLIDSVEATVALIDSVEKTVAIKDVAATARILTDVSKTAMLKDSVAKQARIDQ